MVGEPMGDDDGETAQVALAETDSPGYPGPTSLVDMMRHGNGVNYCFLDGHVIWSPNPQSLIWRSKKGTTLQQ